MWQDSSELMPLRMSEVELSFGHLRQFSATKPVLKMSWVLVSDNIVIVCHCVTQDSAMFTYNLCSDKVLLLYCSSNTKYIL